MPKHYADTTRNPDTMTADERRDEVAGILARGLVRALEAKHTAESAIARTSTKTARHALNCRAIKGSVWCLSDHHQGAEHGEGDGQGAAGLGAQSVHCVSSWGILPGLAAAEGREPVACWHAETQPGLPH